ncbi:lipopolysaccharide/colanic/teichoic acid biosynthesis glycosyltransferase [Paenibacillus phyllosphaerae]|uniref:Lipopolysaccharide/colanic/teichoic acid biosynthesis glycosyltransferase n=1 Tax=Paenibacillus phyllosphaerae TaxID=274593 RepID=A0A7W5AUL8_9BACL|nr:sugar transferase [Paenibacillus phyllosphaerae]MBB3108571.1 lipopolysaccharide/colanic/teichoic acid biosynthesis glycosyltransferase [Paenibacillus phyllosphaerae]
MTPQRGDSEAVLDAYYPSIALEKKKNIRMYLMAKRALDIIGASIGILILLPLFLVIVIIMKIEDPRGPIFFHQKRVGKNEILFKMYKFRSMVTNAEELLQSLLSKNEIEGHMFKMKDDPRITKFGKIMRKTSIDELPQLWNVLRGDMSLVGPRPALEREVAEYTKHDKLRLKVTPGCTGLWQVSGRNSLSFSQMVDLDIQYIRQRSIVFDIKIILKTVKVLFGSKDAF